MACDWGAGEICTTPILVLDAGTCKLFGEIVFLGEVDCLLRFVECQSGGDQFDSAQ